MPLSEVFFASRRPRVQLKDVRRSGSQDRSSGSHDRSSGSPRRLPLTRPHSASFSTPLMDLSPSPLSPSSHYGSYCPGLYTTTTTPPSPGGWSSGTSTGGPLDGERGEVGGYSGARSPVGGHSRLPSTDSGIQADAGWDSLSRSQHKTFNKASAESPTSPESRTPLKTLTRCLMESRATPTRSSWGEMSSRPRDVRPLSSDYDVRSRTASCDSDVRSPASGMSTRMISSFPSGSTRTLGADMAGRAPTTRGEEEDGVKRGLSWRRGDSVLSRSVDSALPVSSVTSPVSSIGASGSLTSKKDGVDSDSSRTLKSDRAAGSLYPEHANSIGSRPRERSDFYAGDMSCQQPGSLYSHDSSSSDHGGRGKGYGGQCPLSSSYRSPSSLTSPTAFSAGTVSGGKVTSEDRPSGPLSLLSSSVPMIPSRSRAMDSREVRGSPHRTEWGLGSRLAGKRDDVVPYDRGADEVRLQRFQLASPTVPSSLSCSRYPQSSAGREAGVGGERPQGVLHHLRPRVTPLSVAHLVNSNAGRTRHVQVVHRPAGMADALGEGERELTSSNASTSRINSSSSPHSRTPPAKSGDGQGLQHPLTSPKVSRSLHTSPQDPHQLNTLQSPSSTRIPPQVSVTPVAKLSQPIPAHASSTPSPITPNNSPASRSGSANAQHLSVTCSPTTTTTTTTSTTTTIPIRPRHITPIFRSKLSPVLSRNLMRARHPLSRSMSPTSSSPSSPGRPIPIKHVDTCSACLKPTTTTNTSTTTSSTTSPGDTHTGSDAASETTTSSERSTSLGSDDVRVHLGTSRVPDGVLQLLQRSAGVAVGERGGEGGGDGEVGERVVPVLDVRKEVPWKERRSRIDLALAWLRAELESLRAMDTALMSQFRRCQDTIESLKQQHHDLAWGDGEGSEWGWGLDGSEWDEEEEAWEDWEIAEFERRWAENPDARELEITLVPATSSETMTNGVTTTDVTTPVLTSENGTKSPSPIKQDVEAKL